MSELKKTKSAKKAMPRGKAPKERSRSEEMIPRPTAEQTSAVIQKISEIAAPLLTELGLDLVEIQYRRELGRLVLRLFIDREPTAQSEADAPKPLGSGVTLDDCSKLSRELGYLLDINEVMPAKYNLEVSSPGLDRLLNYPADFTRYKGRQAALKLREAEGKKTVNGELAGVTSSGDILIKVEEEILTFNPDILVSARLVPQLDWRKPQKSK